MSLERNAQNKEVQELAEITETDIITIQETKLKSDQNFTIH